MSDKPPSHESRHEIRIHIDRVAYHSPNPTNGKTLYVLGKVPAGHELFREVAGNHEDVRIVDGDEHIHLTEDEHFYSAEKRPHLITIIVNATPKKVEKGKFSFDQIVKLAYETPPFGENTLFRVTYRKGKGEKEHTLDDGHFVEIAEGMIFDVTPTDRS